jgi:DNA-binding MarR family transcriptional regulator
LTRKTKAARTHAPEAPVELRDTRTAISDLAASGLDQRVGYMLRVAQAAVLRDLMGAFKPFGLRPSQYACLLVIQAEPGLKQQRVGEILTVKHSNLVATIDELEARGFIARERLPGDRRAKSLHLTSAGTAFVKRLRRVEAAHRRRLSQAVGEADIRGLLATLNTLAQLD